MPWVAVVTKRFFLCPNCGNHEFAAEHLFSDFVGREFGPWRCSHCNHGISGRVTSTGIEITKVEAWDREPVLCLFRFRDLYLIVNSYTRPNNYEHDWYDYLFHSHQCPTNMLKHVEEVICPSEGTDPHGILRFIAAIPDPGELVYERDYSTLDKVFKLFNTDGTEAATTWPEKERGLLPVIARLQDAHRKLTSAKA